MTEAHVWDDTVCALGEGPLWHPLREQLFWFDIIKHRLYTRKGDKRQSWGFDEYVSAAGWVDASRLLIASSSKLFLFDVDSGVRQDVHPLEDDNPVTRSNDGRADPWGGFWIGTMGKNAETGAGAIYRYYKGEVRRLYDDITISNAICFAPDRSVAYWTDSARGQVMRQPLAATDGWPEGTPEVWLDFSGEDFAPDGAVVDADGVFWNAQWGAARIAAYDPDGTFLTAIPFPAAHTSCPAFGGPNLSTLYCTTATQGIADIDLTPDAPHGRTFACETKTKGQREHQVLL